MSYASIHLNDIGLLTSTDGDVLTEDPGIALLLDDGLKIGNEANQLAKLHPRKVNDTYWQSPSIEPLKAVPNYVRHHTDLIYHHLTKLHKDLGEPAKIILAVPSSLNAEQLSYILGVADALPFEFSGLCDLAVAGTVDSGLRGTLLHYDLQRHQTVITLINADTEAEKKDVILAPNLGLHAMQTKWANIISDSFIEQSRFDPMHTAESEQNLYNQLPDWITQLSTSSDLSLEFSTHERTYEAKIERQQFIAANNEFVEALLKKGQELIADPQHHLATQRLESLLNLSTSGSQFKVLAARAVTRTLSENQSEIVVDGEQLPLVTSLAINAENTSRLNSAAQTEIPAVAATAVAATSAVTENGSDSPTHLLVDNTASSLPSAGQTINLSIKDNHLITTSSSDQILASITHNEHQLLISSKDPVLRLNNKSIGENTIALESGDILSTAGGLSARLITVAG